MEAIIITLYFIAVAFMYVIDLYFIGRLEIKEFDEYLGIGCDNDDQ
jgi:hypothetical protein